MRSFGVTVDIIVQYISIFEICAVVTLSELNVLFSKMERGCLNL